MTGCKPPGTQFLVVVRTDLDAPSEFNALRIVDHTESSNTLTIDVEDSSSAITFAIVPKTSEIDQPIDVSIEARLNSTAILSRRVQTHFIEGEALRLPVYLLRDCIEIAEECEEDETCGLSPDGEAECLSPMVNPETLGSIEDEDSDPPLPMHGDDHDAGAGDAAVDAGGGDSGDATPVDPCLDDGLVSADVNGETVCVCDDDDCPIREELLLGVPTDPGALGSSSTEPGGLLEGPGMVFVSECKLAITETYSEMPTITQVGTATINPPAIDGYALGVAPSTSTIPYTTSYVAVDSSIAAIVRYDEMGSSGQFTSTSTFQSAFTCPDVPMGESGLPTTVNEFAFSRVVASPGTRLVIAAGDGQLALGNWVPEAATIPSVCLGTDNFLTENTTPVQYTCGLPMAEMTFQPSTITGRTAVAFHDNGGLTTQFFAAGFRPVPPGPVNAIMFVKVDYYSVETRPCPDIDMSNYMSASEIGGGSPIDLAWNGDYLAWSTDTGVIGVAQITFDVSEFGYFLTTELHSGRYEVEGDQALIEWWQDYLVAQYTHGVYVFRINGDLPLEEQLELYQYIPRSEAAQRGLSQNSQLRGVVVSPGGDGLALRYGGYLEVFRAEDAGPCI